MPGNTGSSCASNSIYKIGQRVHSVSDCRRIGTVKYIGAVEGYSGNWMGVDWDSREGKNDGSINGVHYFQASSQKSASFVRPKNLSPGITLLEALLLRYGGESSNEYEDEMYVLSASNRRVAVQLVGTDKIQNKLSRFSELPAASLAYLGVQSPGSPSQISNVVPNLKELDLTGNLLSEWEDIDAICEGLPALVALNLSHNMMMRDMTSQLPHLKNILILVLNYTGIKWTQIEALKHCLPTVKELHLMGNKISHITPTSSTVVEGFNSLQLLNLEENLISVWGEILKLSQLNSLTKLHLNKNYLSCISYPFTESQGCKPFENLRCLLLGANSIEEVNSIDSLNLFPRLTDIRLSENPIVDPASGGIPRFAVVARLAKVEILNGSEVSPRERKESEIRYVRLVMSKMNNNHAEIMRLHPRYFELKRLHRMEDDKGSSGVAGPQKMASGLLSITLKCVGASIGEKPPLTKKLPATTTVGKLKILCESFFKLKSTNLKLFFHEAGPALPIPLDNDMEMLLDLGIDNESTVLVDEES